MFCSNCGKQLGPETNFCPACGTRVARNEGTHAAPPSAASASASQAASPSASQAAAPPPDASQLPPSQPAGYPGEQRSRQLTRPRSPRVFGGVCAAFALHYGWNLDLVRIVTAFFALFYGVGVLAYLACWIILPEAQYALPSQSR